MIRARSLNEAHLKKNEMKKAMYTKFLTQFCKKICMFNSFGQKHATFQVPPFYVGGPVYDVYEASMYLRRQLERLGYRASVTDRNGTIYVAWGSKEKPEKEEHKEQEEDGLPSLANLKKAADSLRKKFGTRTINEDY